MLDPCLPSTVYWTLSSFRARGPRPFAQAAEYLVYSDNHRSAPAEAEALWEGSVPEAQGREAMFVWHLAGHRCLEGSGDVAWPRHCLWLPLSILGPVLSCLQSPGSGLDT